MLWNKRLNVVGVLGIVPLGLGKETGETRERIEIIQTTAFLGLARILRRVLKT